MGGIVKGIFGGGGGGDGGDARLDPATQRQLLQNEALFNRVDQTTPFGSLTFSGPERNQLNLEFSPELQALYGGKIDLARGLLSSIPGSSDAATQALLDRLQPQFQLQEDQLRSRLENSGNPAAFGGQLAEGSFNELSLMNQRQNDARLAALLAGPQFQNQLISGVNSLAQIPQYQFQGGVPVNSAGTLSAMAGLEAANAQARAQQNSGLLGGLFDLGSAVLGAGMFGGGSAAAGSFGSITPFMAASAPMLSDRRAKTDIRRVGDWQGVPLYRFRYKTGGPVQIGVMADEVAKIVPEAVSTGPHGYQMVDYGRLAESL